MRLLITFFAVKHMAHTPLTCEIPLNHSLLHFSLP